MEVVKVWSSKDASFGVASSLVVALYRGRTTLEMLEQLDALQSELIKKHPRISTLTVIGQLEMLKVDEAVRGRSVELGKKFEKNVRGSAIVVSTKGLAAVMVRTFLSGFFLLSKSEMPMKTFASTSEALAWLQSLPDQDMVVKTEVSVSDVERYIALP